MSKTFFELLKEKGYEELDRDSDSKRLIEGLPKRSKDFVIVSAKIVPEALGPDPSGKEQVIFTKETGKE
jgi:hypothetical protein